MPITNITYDPANDVVAIGLAQRELESLLAHMAHTPQQRHRIFVLTMRITLSAARISNLYPEGV